MAAAETQTTPPAAAKSTQRDHLIHIVRGLAIWGVVTIHLLVHHIGSDGVGGKTESVAYEWTNWFLIWCVPWFVLSGGAVSYWSMKRLLARTEPGRDRRRAIRGFMWARLQRMLIPYFAFAVIMTTVEILLGTAGFRSCQSFGLKQALTWIIPFPHEDCLVYTRWPYWFLMFYIPVALATPLLVWIFDKRWGPWLLVGGSALVILFNDRVVFNALQYIDVNDAQAMAAVLTPTVMLQFLASMFCGFIAFFAVGFLYANGMLRDRRRLAGIAGATLMVVTILLMAVGPYTRNQQQFPLQAGYLFWGCGTFLVLAAARPQVERFWRLKGVRPAIDWLSVNSYTIYIWHFTAILAMWWTIYFVGLRDGLYGLPVWAQHLILYALVWVYLIPLIAATRRFESWSFPPNWWTRRRAAPATTET